MPRFFVNDIDGEKFEIFGEDAKHISRSLRMRTGEKLTLSDQKGYDYNATIDEIQADRVIVTITEKLDNQTEPKVKITLYQAVPKGDKLDFIVQKAVELGVAKIVPFLSDYTVSRPKGDSAGRKTKRLQTISHEAAKQSERGIIPEITEIISFKQMLEQMETFEHKILFYENATVKLSGYLWENVDEIAVIIGSEGGFSEQEVEKLAGKNVTVCSLGARILRCETAAITALSAVLMLSGEF